MSEQSKPNRAEQIRESMQLIRRDLDDDVYQVTQSARTLTSWKYYTSHYPWACIGAAAAIGYLVVPRKLQIQSPDAKTIEKLARKNRLVVESKPKAEARSGMIGAAFTLLSGLVLRTVTAQIGQQLAAVFDRNSAGTKSASSEEPGSTTGKYSEVKQPQAVQTDHESGTSDYGSAPPSVRFPTRPK